MTSPAKINKSHDRPVRILLAPLDWGLGHATRCIPVIKELLSFKCEVIVATSGAQKALLQEEFPFLTFTELTGYSVKYGKNRALTLLKIITLIPKILIRIKHENKWLRQFLAAETIDAVISDNRYGLYDQRIFSVFMTHQLCIKSASGKLADRLLQRINYRAIGRFSLCWVPDLPEGPGEGDDRAPALAGELSHPGKLPAIPLRYIGHLSRFKPCDAGPGKVGGQEPGVGGQEQPGSGRKEPGTASLLILLSGPEPQRTIFEKKLLGQVADYPGEVVLVRGLPGGGAEPVLRDDAASVLSGMAPGSGERSRLRVYDHLPSAELNRLICGAGLVIARSGYSSIMDLLQLGKKCIFVPTPGQTEQEYLGDHLADRGLALCIPQRKFSLGAALDAAKDFPFMELGMGARQEEGAEGLEPGGSATVLRTEIRALLERLRGQI